MVTGVDVSVLGLESPFAVFEDELFELPQAAVVSSRPAAATATAVRLAVGMKDIKHLVESGRRVKHATTGQSLAGRPADVNRYR